MDKAGQVVTAILVAVIGLATVAALVSRNSQTASVIGAGGKAFSQILGTALSPVTGGSNPFGNVGLTGFNPIGIGFDPSQLVGGLLGGIGGNLFV